MIKKFLQYIEYEKNYSTHTICSYQNDLKQFAEFAGINYDQFNPSLIQAEHIQQWILISMNSGMSARTISRRIESFVAFFDYFGVYNQKSHIKNYTSQNKQAASGVF